jgi:LysR family transcriptional regulator for metE and metH
MLQVADLRMLSAVAKSGNLTRAALRLNTTQSALSHRLATLEAKVGTLMFERLGRTMRPTLAGTKLVTESEEILERLSQATATAMRAANAGESLLRIATQCYTCYSWLPSVLTRYKSVCPNVKVEIVLDATYRIADSLLEGKLDVGITTAALRNRRLCSQPLFEDELLVVMRPDHPLAKRTWLQARDLSEENLYTYNFPIEENAVLKRLFKANRYLPKSISRVPLTEAIIDMVQAGLGVSVLARWAVGPHLRAGTICGRPITNSGLRREWHVAMLRSTSKRPHQMHFINMLRAQLRRNGVDGRDRTKEGSRSAALSSANARVLAPNRKA